MLKRTLLLTLLTFLCIGKVQAFCGPHATQYMPVDSSLYAPHQAVLCLFVVDENSYAFYTEGRVQGKTFRTLGYIRRQGSTISRYSILSGQNYSLNGSGEEDTGYAATAMHMIHDYYLWNATNAPQVIVESNSRPTVWKRALVEYQPQGLRRITHCGNMLKTVHVAARPNDIRCVLPNENHEPKVWLGVGEFNGQPYMHLGTAFFAITGPLYGAVDLCLPGYICNKKLNFGELSISPRPQNDGKTHYFVTGAWTEGWIEP